MGTAAACPKLSVDGLSAKWSSPAVVFCTPWANTRTSGSRDRGAVELPGVRQRADDETPRTTTSAS